MFVLSPARMFTRWFVSPLFFGERNAHMLNWTARTLMMNDFCIFQNATSWCPACKSVAKSGDRAITYCKHGLNFFSKHSSLWTHWRRLESTKSFDFASAAQLRSSSHEVTHGPPKCSAWAKAILKTKPQLHIFGHDHATRRRSCLKSPETTPDPPKRSLDPSLALVVQAKATYGVSFADGLVSINAALCNDFFVATRRPLVVDLPILRGHWARQSKVVNRSADDLVLRWSI